MSKTRQKRLSAENEYIHELNIQSINRHKTQKVPASKKLRKVSQIKRDPDQRLEIKINTMSMSKELIEHIIVNYPNLFARHEALLFLHILGTATQRCKKTGGIKFSRNKLAKMLRRHPDNVRLCDFLEEMKLLIPELEWTEYEFMTGDCTVITNTGLKDLLEKIAHDTGSSRIFLQTMREATRQNKRAYSEQIKKMLATRIWKNQDTKIISDYLTNLPYTYFEQAEKHFPTALMLAMEEDTKIKDHFINRQEIENNLALLNRREPKKIMIETAENYHMLTLLAIRDMWKPFYFEVSHSDRIFGTEPTFLKSSLRKILWPEWIDFDLKNCQLVIVAHLFKLSLCLAFLDTGRSIWDHSIEYMGIDEKNRREAKEYLKTALYSIIFGMEKSDAVEILENELACHGIFWRKSFSTSPLVQEITIALHKAQKQIEKDGRMDGAYGVVKLEEGISAKGVLACVVQSYEMLFISACYEVANKEKQTNHDTYDIVLHQHDGFSIRLKKGADLEKICARFQKAIASRLKNNYEMTTHMILTYK